MKKLFLSILFFAFTSSLFSQVWIPLQEGTNNGFAGGIRLKSYRGKLIASGQFNQAGQVNAHGYGLWDGNTWNIVDEAFNNFSSGNAMEVFNGELYTFGAPTPDSLIMFRLDHDYKWHPVPNCTVAFNNGAAGSTVDMVIFNNELYVIGDFDKIGNIYAKNIARWDGSQWHSVGSGLNDYAIHGEVYNGELYVCGQFTQAGNTQAKKFARWNGNQWNSVGNGLEQGNFITVMKTYKEKLYIGGLFTQMGGQETINIAVWNGLDYSPVGNGVGTPNSNDYVTGMGIFEDKLYVGGYFGVWSGVFANEGGIWDGNQWDSLPRGLSSGANDFEYYDCHLYAGGSFTGIINGVGMLDVYDCSMSVNESHKEIPISTYPNPTNGKLFIDLGKETGVMLGLYDISGKIVFNESMQQSTQVHTIDLSMLPQGIYVLKVISDGKVSTTKVVKQ